jgi:hypothetical protein
MLNHPPIHPSKADYDEAVRAISITRWRQMREYYEVVINRFEAQHPVREWTPQQRMEAFRAMKVKTGKVQ